MAELEVQETVIVEKEYDSQGRVVREVTTVTRPKKLEPVTPFKNPYNPPFTWPQPYTSPKPYWQQEWHMPNTVWCGDPPPSYTATIA